MTYIDASPPLSLLSAEQRNELELLLQPVNDHYPSGPPIRFDPIFTEIRLVREEDDPHLPMGVWKRPLKRADWARIEARCKDTLGSHAKDLQIAAWLAEAWCRQHGMEGFLRGLLLIHGLLARYWETVHPQVDEDGDAELRVAPLEWMNASLSQTISRMVPLLGRAAGQLDRLSLMDWEHMAAREAASARQGSERSTAPESAELPQTRADLIDYATANLRADVDRSTRLVRACLAVVMAIASLTDARLGADAPTMSKLRETLRAMERALLELTAEGEPEVAQQRDAMLIPEGPSTDMLQPEEEVAGDMVQPNHTPPASVAQSDGADPLGRRIDAICAAAGIHAPSGAERLMAMQVGLLHDQNAILQTLVKEQAGQQGTDAASGDFTALVRAVLAGTVTVR